MTYTILGRCAKTGRLGIGIATFSITVGRYAHCAKAMTGVTISQAYANENNRPKKDGTTTPKHADLINSISDIRAAIVESFWEDALTRLPGDRPEWVEVWLSSEDLGTIEAFESLCRERNLELGEGRLTFPERTVMLVLANHSQLGDLIERSDSIAELRAAREVATFFIEEENRDQAALVDDLLSRSQFENVDRIVVLVLDHGVNNGHRLLEPLLSDDDCHTVNAAWGTNDHAGHGTLMAGTAAYGNLLESIASNNILIIRRGLELGVDYSITQSCYDPGDTGAACGHCDACQLRLRGFAEAGASDPAPYISG